MFNEAFWFFYLVGLVETIRDVIPVITLLIGIATSLAAGAYFFEDVEKAKKWLTGGPAVMVFLLFVFVFTPTPQALYAGGAQEYIDAVNEGWNGESDESN